MKICSISLGRPDTTPAGVEFTLWRLSKEFNNLGCEVHNVFSNSPDTDSVESIVDGIYLHGIGKSNHNNLTERLSFPLSCSLRLKEIEEKFSIDVFAFHGSAALLPLLFFKKYSSKPFIYHSYAALPFEARTHLFNLLAIKDISGFINKLSMYSLYTPVEYLALHYVDKLILPHDATITEFQRYYNYSLKKISIAPLGQDLYERYGVQSIDSYQPKRKQMLLFVGNDWRRKGVWQLLLAFKLVLDKSPNTILVLTGPPHEPFVSLAKKLKLNDFIIFAGNVNEETLAKYYAACDIFVLPSFHEGFSNTLIEAMAFGKPVITTPIAGYPVVTNGEEGFIIRPGDYESLANSIVKLLQNEDLYQIMSKKAMKKAELYNWKEIAKKVLSIYASTLH